MTSLSTPLTKDQKLLLAEALRRCEVSRDAIEDAVVELGRWLLVHVFEDDATAALEGRRDNPVWRELLERAGGPSLKMPARAINIAVRIAAYDKRIQDEAWRNLEPGRKELLLPLGADAALREGAQHVTAMKLSHRDTKAYVKAHLAPKERAREKKTSRFVVRRLSSLAKRLDAPFRRSTAQAFTKGSPEERAAIKQEITALRDLASQLLADLKGK